MITNPTPQRTPRGHRPAENRPAVLVRKTLALALALALLNGQKREWTFTWNAEDLNVSLDGKVTQK